MGFGAKPHALGIVAEIPQAAGLPPLNGLGYDGAGLPSFNGLVAMAAEELERKARPRSFAEG